MPNFRLEIKDGKFDFDHAFENMDWDEKVFEEALNRFASIQAQPFKTELWKQYNAWKRKSQQ
jgi:hypothetical protein